MDPKTLGRRVEMSESVPLCKESLKRVLRGVFFSSAVLNLLARPSLVRQHVSIATRYNAALYRKEKQDPWQRMEQSSYIVASVID